MLFYLHHKGKYMKSADAKKMDKLREYSGYPAKVSTKTPLESSEEYLTKSLFQLQKAAKSFASLTIDQRIDLVKKIQKGFLEVAERSVEAGCMAKGINIGSTAEAEEWATGPWGIVRQLRLISESLRALQMTGNTNIGKVSSTAKGNLSVRVFPNNAIDSTLHKDVTVDVYMQPHVTEKSLDATRASFYKNPDHQGKVVLVLGAGNIAAIGVMDVLTKMFNEGKVCLLKMNPVNAYLGPFIEEAFKEAIDKHYFAVVYGGAEVGRHLVYHPNVDEVHLTGSDKTFDQIVWGAPGPNQSERKLNREPLLKKPITSELGNISPIIVIPGPYKDKEIAFQAEAIAAAMTMNASFFCNSAKMMVMPEGWSGTGQFMQAIQKACAAVELRQAYYPGAEDRWKLLTEGRKNVMQFGIPKKGELPWTFLTNLNTHNGDEILFHEEPFCSILSEVRVGSEDPIDFIEKAINFVNNQLWGTLNATIIVHPSTLKDPVVSAMFEKAIIDLEYGTVAVNTFPGISFVFASPPWGAYPNSTSTNIQSGNGFVHNTFMLEGIEKSVIRAPLSIFPKPAFLTGHRTAQTVMQRIVAMEENASWTKVPGIVWAAMQG